MRMAAQTAAIEAGAVHLPARALWLEDFKKEILSFPVSKHDDRIDALSQALQCASAPGPPVAALGTYNTVR
jgi:predicted phage terminase large subunit-like protein